MSLLRILGVTSFLAKVNTAIIWTATDVSAAEAACPFLSFPILLLQFTFQLFVLGATKHLSLHFATVTSCVYFYFTGSAKPFVTRPSAGMFATG